MTPQHTLYRLAHSSKDYSACHAILGDEEAKLSWPTVVADRNGEVVGFLSTQRRNDAIVAGPLKVADLPNKSFVALRLAEAYENVMRAAEVRSYLISVEEGNDWSNIVEKAFDIRPFDKTDGFIWFKRVL